MEKEKVILAFGSNIGNREENIKTALKFLDANQVKLLKLSSFYKSNPVEYTEQPEFLNCAGIFKTPHSPFKLLRLIKQIEKKMGRKKQIEKGPRNIDIDIIFYSRVCINTYNLQLPHSSYKDRLFVLLPILEILPDYHPVNSKLTLKELINNCKDNQSQPEKINVFN